ncbi:MAG: ATP-binding protein [Rhodocyclaceae bacterium]|nr:ATP-binding protein [Rhodocyclaceae bacterium]
MIAATTLHVAEPPAAILPPAPRALEEADLPFAFLVELTVKTLYVHGQLRLADLVSRIGLARGVLTPVLGFLRAEKLCEVTCRGETEGATHYTLTALGRTRAEDFMRRSKYTGVAPVSLQSYVKQVEGQSVARMGVTRERLQRAFDGIVIDDGLLNQFGAAMNSSRTIFVYGPSGSGKTYTAERLVGLLSGAVAVPHALLVNDEVIQVFDPLVHEPVRPAQGGATEFDLGQIADARWILCRRPVVMSGAELTMAMVDLEFDPQTRFYHAPQQLKANNGLFILDDLGRQLVAAQALMNRWIVALDRRIDYLSLHTGQKFRVPFDVIVVFSSNLRPSQLADDAFLRRLGYKIFVGPLSVADYRAILQQVCAELRVPYDEAGLDYLLRRHEAESRPLLACQPRDLLCQVCDYAGFHGIDPQMSPELLGWAWENYFARE